MVKYSFLSEAGFVNAARNMAAKNLTNFAKNPVSQGATIGAVTGAAAGMKKDADGKRHIISGALKGSAVGGLAGVAVKKTGGDKLIKNFAKNTVKVPRVAKNPAVAAAKGAAKGTAKSAAANTPATANPVAKGAARGAKKLNNPPAPVAK